MHACIYEQHVHTHSLLAAFREELNAPLVMFNITEQIQNLTALSAALFALNANSDAASARVMVEAAIDELMSIDTQIPSIKAQVVGEAVPARSCGHS